MSHVRTRYVHAIASRTAAAIGLVVASILIAAPAGAQEHDHDHEHDREPAGQEDGSGHHVGLHFTHPLIAESVSPDTKVRLDYGFRDLADEQESVVELEGEYAFHRSFAVEVGVHFDPSAAELGETHAIAKFANYAFEEQGLLLGYGMEIGLPTGAGHAHGGLGDPGHEHAEGEEHEHAEDGHESAEVDEDVYEFAPFLNAGLAAGVWELVGWTRYAIPTNQADPATRGPELRYSLSALLHATDRLEPLLEVNGTVGMGGPRAERETLAVSPGLRVRPIEDRPLVVGGAVSLPVTDERAYDTRVLISAFWHF